MRLLVAACTAGIVQRRRTVEAAGAPGQADLQQHVPDALHAQVPVGRKLLFAGRAAGDHDRVAEAGKLTVEKLPRLCLHLLPAGPVADRAAAAQHQRHAAVEPRAEILIGRPHGVRCDGRSLAAGEKDVAAALITRLGPRQKGVAVGKEHVQQRKFVGRKGHLIRGNHVLPRQEADTGHIKAVGADHRALSAEGAGVHGLVELVVAHDDLGVVVDLPGQKSGMLFVMSEIGAAFQALLTVALDAAPGLLDGLLPGIAAIRDSHTAQLFCRREVGVESALRRALLPAGIAGIQLLRQAVHRQRRFLRAEGRVQHALCRPADQALFLADHQLRDRLALRKEPLPDLVRGAEHIKGRLLLLIKRRVQAAAAYESDLLALQPLELQGEGSLVQKRRGTAEIGLRILFLTEHRDGIGLLFQLPRQQQRKEPGAEDGGLLPLARAKDAAEPGLLAEAGHRPLHLPDGRSVADLPQAALALTGRFAAPGQDQREGRDLFIDLQGLFEVAVRRRLEQSAGIQLQRAGRTAEGRLLVDAAGHHALHLFLGDLVDLIDVGRAPFLDLRQGTHLP